MFGAQHGAGVESAAVGVPGADMRGGEADSDGTTHTVWGKVRALAVTLGE
jgi:hypothetical protein